MAASQKLTDHFLTCTVCTDVFNDPCTLECHHTFCRKCVISFTKTQSDAVAAKSIPCPFCRKWTKVTNPVGPVDQWADNLKPIFLIQGLLDSFGPGSKDTTNCSYCKELGETTPATFWCSVCDNALCRKCILIHKSIPSTRHHDVDTISSDDRFKRRRKVTCKEHTNEYIEFHCKDCKKAICQKCCLIYHRKCESVVTLESELVEMKAALTKHRDMLLKKEDLRRMNTEKQKIRLEEATKTQSDIKWDIETMYERVFDIMKQKKIRLLHEVDEITQQQADQLRADIKTGEMAIQMYQQQSELIGQAVKSDSEMDVYEMYQSCESGAMGDTDTELKDKRSIARIILRNTSEEVMKTLNELQLCTIDVMYVCGFDLKATPVLQDTINVHLPCDTMRAYPADVTVLDVNGIDTFVCTDCSSNKSVKSFYSRNNQPHHSKLKLNSKPCSLTQVKHNEVAVTIPSPKRIVIVEVNPDLKLLSTITTQKPYRGITLLSPSTLAVGSVSPPCVDVLDMSGTIIRTISPHHKNMITIPNFLSTTRKGNILLSNYASGSVICLTPEGDVVFNYSDNSVLKCASGVTSTSTGDILVADYSLQNVLHLTESGQFVRNILTPQDGLSTPLGIFIEKHGRLYVCDCTTESIKVFNCGLSDAGSAFTKLS